MAFFIHDSVAELSFGLVDAVLVHLKKKIRTEFGLEIQS
jgi:hypothetical protein